LRGGDSVETISIERASDLLAERRAAGPSPKKAPARKATAKKSTAKKTTTKTVKKSAKKTAAKKTGVGKVAAK
jgi:DNA topoisomerase-1